MDNRRSIRFEMRVSNSEVREIENLANSFVDSNGNNVSLAQAVRLSLLLARKYLIKQGTYRPIKTQAQILAEEQRKEELVKKYGFDNYAELNRTLELSWLDD